MDKREFVGGADSAGSAEYPKQGCLPPGLRHFLPKPCDCRHLVRDDAIENPAWICWKGIRFSVGTVDQQQVDFPAGDIR
jgi:hypothetical protein